VSQISGMLAILVVSLVFSVHATPHDVRAHSVNFAEKFQNHGLIQAQEKLNSLKSGLGTTATKVSVSSTPDRSAYKYVKSQSVSITAVVSSLSGSGTPTGKVTFSYSFNGTTPTSSTVTLSGGKATYTTTALKQGPNLWTISFAGDSTWDASQITYPLWADIYTFQQTDVTSGQKKCYEIPGILYGIHMTNYNYVPGTCDRSVYPLTDCWYSWDQAGFDLTAWYYVYRHWAVGSTCPESQCCCGGATDNSNPASKYGDCTSNFLPTYGNGANCAALYPGFAGATWWTSPHCDNTVNYPREAAYTP